MDSTSSGGKEPAALADDSSPTRESLLLRIFRQLSTRRLTAPRVHPVSATETPLHLHIRDVNNSNNNNSKPPDPLSSSNSEDKDLPHEDVYNVDYPRAIALLGTAGMFHLQLALACGFMFLAAGLQNNLNAYILSSVRCDLQISSSQMGLLNAVFLIGGISSNFMWGVVADMLGRRTVVVYGMLLDGILTLASSLSQNYATLLVFRFLNGFIVGGPSALVFAYMGEFFATNERAKAICYVGAFWTLSWVIMPAVAWLVIPQQWSVVSDGFVFNSWRLLVALAALPSLLSAVLLSRFPESPMFLLIQGKDQEALDILTQMYRFNNKHSPDDYPVNSLRPHMSQNTAGKSEPKSVCRPVMILFRQVQHLFSSPTVNTTVLTSFLFFSNMFGYYGLGLWLPELFNRMSSHLELEPEAQVTMCTAGLGLATNSTADDIVSCDPTHVDTSVFQNSLIMGIVGLLGNVISGVLADRLHRRTLPVTLMGLSSVCVMVIHYTPSVSLNVVLASTFTLTVGTANLVYNSLVVDMFPPNVSGMGVCMAVLSGRLGAMVSNLVFGHLLNINRSVPVFLVAIVLFAGSAVSLLIPKEPYSERALSTSSEVINEDIFVVS